MKKDSSAFVIPTLGAQVAATRYYEGLVCEHCQGTKRYRSNGHCVPCSVKDARARRREKKETAK